MNDIQGGCNEGLFCVEIFGAGKFKGTFTVNAGGRLQTKHQIGRYCTNPHHLTPPLVFPKPSTGKPTADVNSAAIQNKKNLGADCPCQPSPVKPILGISLTGKEPVLALAKGNKLVPCRKATVNIIFTDVTAGCFHGGNWATVPANKTKRQKDNEKTN